MNKRVLIVGAGFGGLNVAQSLGNKRGVDVTLLDRRNYHLFQPLLYQVAMAGLSPAEIAIPIRSRLADYKNINVLLANVETVDLNSKKVKTDSGDFEFDVLVLACGAKHSYFGRNEWEELAPGLKTLEQATEIRRRVLMAFESAEKDAVHRADFLSFVVVGGGPTGVELAGAIGELAHFTLSKDFKNIKSGQAQVILIEAGERILAQFSPKLSAQATHDLKKLGVKVWTKSRVTHLSALGVNIGEKFLPSRTVLWAAGVEPSSLNKDLAVDRDKSGRVMVQDDLTLKGFPFCFVIGDQAHFKGIDGNPLPGQAPVAIQQGRFVGKAILKEIVGKPIGAFRYLDKGQMATIGRRKAVLEFRNIKLSGFLAWMAWLFIHIYYLIGFKNRLFVLIQWAWQYFSYSRGARLILHKEWRSFLGNRKLL